MAENECLNQSFSCTVSPGRVVGIDLFLKTLI